MKPKTVSELKVTMEKMWNNFPINKAVQSFKNRLTEYVKGGGRHSEHFSLLKKCSYLQGLHCIELRQLLIMSKLPSGRN